MAAVLWQLCVATRLLAAPVHLQETVLGEGRVMVGGLGEGRREVSWLGARQWQYTPRLDDTDAGHTPLSPSSRLHNILRLRHNLATQNKNSKQNPIYKRSNEGGKCNIYSFHRLSYGDCHNMSTVGVIGQGERGVELNCI